LIRTDLDNLRDILASLFSLAEPPTALVAVNDATAFALLDAARSLGIRVPEDLSVIGFDDTEAHLPQPGMLTSVHQPFYDMGQRAAELLLCRQAAPDTVARGPYRHLLLPTTLVIRSTCKPLRKEG
ncbi:MAG TPA: substrate-binding domain-containing protein, partial [Chthonomonadaceae bacterium]|nr:substrate-binding domain-containing protein [Chthonomonadaceae bacterium]